MEKNLSLYIMPSKRNKIRHSEFVLCKDGYGYYIPTSDESKKEAIKSKEIYELYLISDEDLKEGDIVLEIERNRVAKVLNSNINEEGNWDLLLETLDKVQYYPINLPRKIIATTDNSYLEENKYISISDLKSIRMFIDNKNLFIEELKKKVSQIL